MGKINNELDWITAYAEYILSEGKRPVSVFKFAKEHDKDESDFYAHFSSFEALERSVFRSFVKKTVKLVQEDVNYPEYNSRQRLLSFFYTFIELMTTNRSLVHFVLGEEPMRIKSIRLLNGMRTDFLEFVKSLDPQDMDLPIEALNKFTVRSKIEGAWVQFLLILQFWMKDESPAFEKTDIFIEKSVNASFDLIDSSALNSMLDLGRFLFKEKMAG